MKLLISAITKKLLANGAKRDQDRAPVCKFFNPCGAATWLISEMDPKENDILFGLCDLGFGSPELGSVSLSELASIKLRFGLGIERDLHFKADHPMSWYADKASAEGRISA
jgi:hypothetical protein